MRVVVCDQDALLREMVEALIARLGFDIVGIADTTAASVALIHAARPDVVIYDLALGYNTDFDVIGAAITVGAKTVVFSHSADEDVLSHYKPRPTIVPKPDLVGLEQVLARLEVDDDRHQVTEQERRRRPVRVAGGPPPMGVTDAQAFYEALSSVTGDDALVTLELSADGTTVGQDLLAFIRDTDRLVASLSAVRVLLPGAGEAGLGSFIERLRAASLVPSGTVVRSIIVAPGESSTEAFDRLKAQAEAQTL